MHNSLPVDAAMVRRLQGKAVLVVGDIMLDAYLKGDAERISPEAPVPVVRITEETHVLGGAGNVAANIVALGGEATLIGITGKDVAADTIGALLACHGIKPALLAFEQRRTTVKTRIMAQRQQMLRLDHETLTPLAESERAQLLKTLLEEAARHDVIIFSDYAKGLVDAAFTNVLHQLKTMPNAPKVLVDPKPQNFPFFGGADLLTPNLKETSEAVAMPARSRDEILAAGRSILERFGCTQLLSTLGPLGMALFLSKDEVWHLPTVAHDVFDVTGAGDTVIATIGLALAAGCSYLQACMLANCAAGIVVAKVGAATVSTEQLETFLEKHQAITPSRWA